MRLRHVLHIVGILVAGLGVTMLIATIVALVYREEDLFSQTMAAGITIGAGLIIFFLTGRAREKLEISHRGAFAVVTFGWLACCLFGALPYLLFAHLPAVWFSDAPQREQVEGSATVETMSPPDCDTGKGLGVEFCSLTNSVFESTSGFTTTGATILKNGLWKQRESRKGGLPHGLLFWRALTHFLGGMGIIVLGVAILPLLGVGGMELFKAEVPGPVKDKIAPRVAETARLLWKVYAGLTVLEFLLLLLTGQGPFLALCHSFATMATGGFSPLAKSIEGLHSPVAEWIIAVFMFLAGANFALHFTSLRKGRPIHWRDHEFRFYAFITMVFIVLIGAGVLAESGMGVHGSIRAGVFQTLTILTTTGFSSSDFAAWGIGIQTLIFLLFFIGGCSGSTGGGIKCVRVLLMAKLAIREIKRLTHPHSVIQTKLSGQVVSGEVIQSIAGFVILYLSIFFVSVAVLAVGGHEFKTSLTAVGACIGSIGPGLGPVGPSGSYNFFAVPHKWLLMFDMIAGRLEIYSVLIVLSRGFWKK
jgi:trk system potassium uptake protein TrkH